MIQKIFFKQNGIRWGSISLLMSISIYIAGFTVKYDWQWMHGAPFLLFYMFALLGIVGIPILLCIQGFKMGKLWVLKKTISLDQVILFLFPAVLYGALLILGKDVWDW